MEQIFGIYGASGFGREVMPWVRELMKTRGLSSNALVFIDDAPETPLLNGHRALTFDEFCATDAHTRSVALAIAKSSIREKLATKCASQSMLLETVIASNVMVLDEVNIGEGAILCPFSCITSNVQIGKHFHANIYSYVAHDCVIGDYVTFAPGVMCNGNVHIEDHAYIGTGAIIKQGTPDRPLVIGRGAVIGMGAVVTKDVPAGVTVVGNPAKPFQK